MQENNNLKQNIESLLQRIEKLNNDKNSEFSNFKNKLDGNVKLLEEMDDPNKTKL